MDDVRELLELNQVLVRFEDDTPTDAALEAVQASGEVWLSGTTWDGRKAIRVSVSNWQTDDPEKRRTSGRPWKLGPTDGCGIRSSRLR